MMISPLIEQLIQALRCLPGVGPKSAQRIAYHLLERDRERATMLADCLHRAVKEIEHCQQCNTLCENELCQLCSNSKRDPSILCLVESPIDVMLVEQTGNFRGYYFVLMGVLSPLDGIGPKEIGMEALYQRLQNNKLLQEIIIATNPTVEGEATAHYVAEMAKSFDIKATRIALGVPLGGSLEYSDLGTLSRALIRRDVILI